MKLPVTLPIDVLLYVVLLARIGGFLLFAPVVGAQFVPMRWRILLAAATCLALAGVLPPQWRVPLPAGEVGLPYLAVLLGSELLLGLLVSVFLHVFFETFAFAGHVVGFSMGFAFAQQVDPALQQQSSVMSVFMTQLFTVVFVASGGIAPLIQLAVLSVYRLPPGGAAPAQLGTAPLLAATGQMFATGFRLALPIFCVMLLINVSLGLMTRFGQEFEVLMLAFPVRIAVGFFVIAATVPVWVQAAARMTRGMFRHIGALFQT